jgi:hypothetical protein
MAIGESSPALAWPISLSEREWRRTLNATAGRAERERERERQAGGLLLLLLLFLFGTKHERRASQGGRAHTGGSGAALGRTSVQRSFIKSGVARSIGSYSTALPAGSGAGTRSQWAVRPFMNGLGQKNAWSELRQCG